MKRYWLLVALFLACCTMAQAAGDTLTDVSDWKTYTNDQFKFSFKYPSNVALHLTGDIFDAQMVPKAEPVLWVGVIKAMDFTRKSKLEVGQRKVGNVYDHHGVENHIVQVAGSNAVEFCANNMSMLPAVNVTMYDKNADQIYLSLRLTNDLEHAKEDPNIRLFNQILSTFEFIKPNSPNSEA